MTHEESFHHRTSRVQGRERAKNHGRSSETGRVESNAEQLVDACQTGRRTLDGVVGRRETVHVFVPWRRTWKQQLDRDANQVHVAITPCEHRHGTWRCEDKHDHGEHDRPTKMDDAVRKPCHDVEEGVLMSGKNIANVGAIKDVL